MRLLILPRYGPKGANSRYRLWQYVPLFEQAGVQVDVRPMLGDDYLEQLYRGGKRPFWPTARGYIRSLGRAFRAARYDAVLLDQELAPYLPAAFERLLARANPALIVDYDDAAYCKYENLPILKRKIAGVMAASRAVVVGNHHLAAYAERHCRDVRLIPTVVDDSKYHPKPSHLSREELRVCWIGTPVTAREYLPLLSSVLGEMQHRFSNLVFRVIGAGNFPFTEGLRVESMEWDEATEADLLSECDIGIMPLQDSEFQRGKCGLKLIQYMAAGLPVVASAVGENNYIVEHGENGLLAANASEWIRHLDSLLRNREMRSRMGYRGRQKVKAEYSLRRGFALWNELLSAVRVGASAAPACEGVAADRR